MKQKLLKSIRLRFALLVALLYSLGTGSVWGQVTIWSEDFSAYSADAVPSGTISMPHTGTSIYASGTLSYACTNGTKTSGSTNGGTTAVKNEKLATGTAPEIMVGKKGSGTGAVGGTFTAVVPLDNIEGTLTLTYYQNKNTLKVSSTTTGVSGGQTLKPDSEGQQTTTFTGITSDMTSITIVFEATTTSNVRLDNIVLTGYRADVSVTSLSIKTAPTKVRYEVGESLDMSGFVLDADGEEKTTGYAMTMGGSAISNGATLSSAGKKTITIAYGGKEVTQNISVGAVTGISVTTAPTKTSYDTGDTFDATGMVVTASLSTGELSDPDTWTKAVTGYTYSPTTALAPANTSVTISYSGESTTQVITVTNVAVTGVSLNKTSTTIEKTKTETLTPSFTPSNATNKSVTWESDNTDVATVSAAGVVTAKAAGTATITVTTNDGGKTATCVVTVVNKKGSIDAPYSVADVIDMSPSSTSTAVETDVYVIGYIAGCCNTSTGDIITDPTKIHNTNLALVDDTDDTSSHIAVQLASGDNRTNFNVSDNPHRVGSTKILIKADIFKYCGIAGLKNIDEMSTVAEVVKITDASGFATYASDSPLDFTDKDIDAYIAVTKGDGTGVTFTQVNKVPANTGVLIYNSTGAKTEEMQVFDGTGADAVTGNKFVKGTGATVATDGTTTWNYILNKVGGNIGFYKANGQKVAKNRAYISILKSESESSVKEFISINFDDIVDGVKAIDNVQITINNGAIFNLAGQKLQKLQRGINIVNGKKIIVK